MDIAMQAIGIQQFNKETQKVEVKPFLEHHKLTDLRGKRKSGDRRITGTVRIHDAVVNQLVQLTDVSPTSSKPMHS